LLIDISLFLHIFPFPTFLSASDSRKDGVAQEAVVAHRLGEILGRIMVASIVVVVRWEQGGLRVSRLSKWMLKGCGWVLLKLVEMFDWFREDAIEGT